MKLEIELGAQTHSIDLPPRNPASGQHNLEFTIDGEATNADAAEISPGIYSILIDGKSIEVRVEKFGEGLRISVGSKEFSANVRDPRKWQRNHHAGPAAAGRQNILAPMPGRVVRLLVKVG